MHSLNGWQLLLSGIRILSPSLSGVFCPGAGEGRPHKQTRKVTGDADAIKFQGMKQ
jgi:hypothetical protein